MGYERRERQRRVQNGRDKESTEEMLDSWRAVVAAVTAVAPVAQ